MKIIYSLLLSCMVFISIAGRTNTIRENTQPGATPGNRPLQNPSFRDTFANEIITIPVVIHILYNDNKQNISDAQALSQMESLNKDYRRLNNIDNIPAAFSALSADSKITFCLAATDPQGKPTNGILHKFTKRANWSANDEMKFSASGGDDAWDANTYLNIWVCDLSRNSLGYSSLPGSPAAKDGVVIQYDVFGTTGTLRPPFDKGRTATHEIGHWLGLMHLWGDVLCGDDMIADTPPQRSYNNGCPTFPHTSTCSINANGDMFMNFMDFTDDACMSMFTNGQKNKMRSMFAIGKSRNSFLNSSACSSPSPKETPLFTDSIVNTSTTVSIYPNPATDYIKINTKKQSDLNGQTVIIYNLLGGEIKRQLMTSANNLISLNTVSAGIYMVKIGTGKEMVNVRLIKR